MMKVYRFGNKIIVLSLLAVMLVTAIFFGLTYVSGEELSTLDFENATVADFAEISFADLLSSDGVIVNKDIALNYKELLVRYVDCGGKVLIPNRDNATKILGWNFNGCNPEGDPVCSPVFAYCEDGGTLDTSNMNYRSIIGNTNSISNASAAADGYMYARVSFLVLANSKHTVVANVGLYISVDYFMSQVSDVSYYNVKVEANVTPKDKDYRINSFGLETIDFISDGMDVCSTSDSAISPTVSQGFSHSMGLQAQTDGVLAASGSITYNYSISYPTGSVSRSQKSSTIVDGGYITEVHDNYSITPNDAQYDTSYSFMVMQTVRLDTLEKIGGVGFIFKDLSVTGKYFNPNFEKENTDCVTLIAGWNNPFHTRNILIASGHMPWSGDKSDDYYDNFGSASNLPNEGEIDGLGIYRDY